MYSVSTNPIQPNTSSLHLVTSSPESFLDSLSLNEEQRMAVQSIRGIYGLTAAAGVGKTKVIVSKLRYIRKADPNARALLVISFTRKAVDEIKLRVANEQRISIMTFHSLFYRILRANGFRGYTLLSPSKQLEFAQQVIQETGLTHQLTAKDGLSALHTLSIKEAEKETFRQAYLKKQRAYHVFDFDSMQLFCYQLLLENPAVLLRYQRMFSYLLIDEFQDINPIQWAIVKLLAPNTPTTNLTVVGDPRQSIYGFRGADAGIMDEFFEYYGSSAHRFTLTQNYRSTPSILALGNRIASSFEPLIPVKPQGDLPDPVCYAAADSKSEASFIIRHIKMLHLGGIPYREMAVLYRSSAVSRELRHHLFASRIPMVCSNIFSVFDTKPFQLVTAYLRAGIHTSTRSDWKQITASIGNSESAWKRMQHQLRTDPDKTYSSVLTDIWDDEASKKRAVKAAELLSRIPHLLLKQIILELWDAVLHSYFYDDSDTLDILLTHTQSMIFPQELLKEIALQKKQRQQMEALTRTPDADYVSLMSIHSAKGMEFSTVFLMGAAESILPDTTHETTDIEEERRLAYVAVTRAKDRLYISYAKRSGNTVHQPSRFFEGIFL